MTNVQITRQYHKHDIWGKYLLYHLSQHKNIKVSLSKYPIPTIPVYRGWRNFVPFIYNDIVFIIDDWDHASPTCFLLNNNNIPKFYLNNNTCILKIQYCTSEINNYEELYKQTKIKVFPFTMFSNHSFELENFKWDANYNHKYNCIFSGKPWRNRIGWLRFADINQNEINCRIDLSNRSGDSNNSNSNVSFYETLKETKWGVILKGKGCGGKNRREVEFSSLGMPMALNYIPNYHFPFIPDQDYLLLKSPDDLLKLKDIDPTPFAERSKIIYDQYFSPKNGVYNSFELAYKMAKEFFNNSNDLDFTSIQPDKDLVKITAKQGYHIGPVKTGDVISIQYKGGSWRSWGKSGRSGVNPDNTKGRGGDRAKLAIFHKNNFQMKLIQIVPEQTSKDPYLFNIEHDGLDLYLDICDRGPHARGTTDYIVKLIKK